MQSVWNMTVTNFPQFPPLEEDISADVAVIGGGMAGILCAYQLMRKGAHVVLIEADRISSGVTKGTTAKITSQHGLIYQKIIKDFSLEKAAKYAKANQKAIEEFQKNR